MNETSKAKTKRATNSLLQVARPLKGDASPYFTFEHTPDELAALGYAHVQWAHLEHLIMQSTEALASAISVAVPHGATQDSFRRRLDAFRTVVDQMAEHPHKKVFLKLADKIANENGFRQKLTHGIWSYDLGDPDILHVEISRKTEGPKSHFDTERIVKFANSVGEIAFALSYPGGYDEFQKERAEIGFSFSRWFAKSTQGNSSQ